MQPEKRTLKGYLGISIRGMLMGAADAVPGVSGGTIAFMTGIYEELIYSLKQCGPKALKKLFSEGFQAAWQYINGFFLLSVFGGIIISIISISHVVVYVLDNYPDLLWAFFFGLIFAGVWSVIRHIEKWSIGVISSFAAGAVIAYYVTVMTPTSIEPTTLTVLLSGMIAICAMILPGISGSFILLLLGMYAPMLNAVKSFQFSTLMIFASGCLVGLLSFSRVLNWMFEKHKTMTLGLLGGFMLGSLNKVWPWKYTVESIVDRHGKEVPLVQSNLLPSTFESMTNQSAHLTTSLALMALGVVLVLLMERLGNKVGN